MPEVRAHAWALESADPAWLLMTSIDSFRPLELHLGIGVHNVCNENMGIIGRSRGVWHLDSLGRSIDHRSLYLSLYLLRFSEGFICNKEEWRCKFVVRGVFR